MWALAVAGVCVGLPGGAHPQDSKILQPEGLFALADMDRESRPGTSPSSWDLREVVPEVRPAVGSMDRKPSKSPLPGSPLARRLRAMSIDRLEPGPNDYPEYSEGELQSESVKLRPPRLNLLDLNIEYDVRPDFVESEPYASVLDMEPRGMTPQMRAIKCLAEKELFRHIRKRIKRQWKEQLRNLPNIDYQLYESRLLAINAIGRNTYQDNVDYYASRVREDVFDRGGEGEAEIPVLRLGPLELLDSGSIHLDVSELRRFLGLSKDMPSQPVEVGPQDSLTRQPLFSGKTYKVHSRLRADIDPFRMLNRGEVVDVVRSYGGVVEVVWLTDILKRKRFYTECEVQHRPDGEMRVFFNFVMKSR